MDDGTGWQSHAPPRAHAIASRTGESGRAHVVQRVVPPSTFSPSRVAHLRYIAPSTECWDANQPVMMREGAALPGVNTYRSWPAFRPGYDMAFAGSTLGTPAGRSGRLRARRTLSEPTTRPWTPSSSPRSRSSLRRSEAGDDVEKCEGDLSLAKTPGVHRGLS